MVGREPDLTVINDTNDPLNYYLDNFSTLEINRVRNVSGSCRPPKSTKTKNLVPYFSPPYVTEIRKSF